MKNLPPGTTFSHWFLSSHDATIGGPSIRRWIYVPNGRKRTQRLPLHQYKPLWSNPKELERFVVRLNGDDPEKRRARELTEIKHAYYSPGVLQAYYRESISMRIQGEKNRQTMFHYLQSYAIHWFVVKNQWFSPLDWHRNQRAWGVALLNHDDSMLTAKERVFPAQEIKSWKVLRQIASEANAFLSYLHDKRPEEVKPLILKPWGNKTVSIGQNHEVLRKTLGELRDLKYIPSARYEKIKDELERTKAPWRQLVYLCHDYGLRRNEALGLKEDTVYEDCISVTEQLTGYEAILDKNGKKMGVSSKFGPTKGRDHRDVPHWHMTNEAAYENIVALKDCNLHYDTISTKFAEMTADLFSDDPVPGEQRPGYVLHDLRRCFVTNSLLAGYSHEEVRQAAGHKNVSTTTKHYSQDARDLKKKRFVPRTKQAG